tara:strand:- start:15744 stop:16349 length:606 start_codon:yes stop_codon:yes gene_type:complete
MKQYTEEEINNLLPTIHEVIKSKAFNSRNLNEIMGSIEESRLFRIQDYLDNDDRDEMFDDYIYSMGSYDMNKFMREYGFRFECDIEKPYQASNLMEEQVDELLAKLKLKFDYLPNLENALGKKLVAELREWEEYESRIIDNTNIDEDCICTNIVDNEDYEIEGCAKHNNLKSDYQWIGGNRVGNFYQTVCECGKVSKPFYK